MAPVSGDKTAYQQVFGGSVALRSLVLAGGDARAEGESILAALGRVRSVGGR